MPTLYLMVGLPAAGKTTRARALEAEHHALRLSPDAWMVPLFGASDPDGARDVLEGRLVAVALRALELGVDVVLDFGLWGRDERSALRALAGSVGAAARVVHVGVDRATQLERVRRRWHESPGATFAMTEAELDRWRAQFEVPDAAELAGRVLPEAPPGSGGWAAWAAVRWPTSDQRG